MGLDARLLSLLSEAATGSVTEWDQQEMWQIFDPLNAAQHRLLIVRPNTP